MLIKTFMPYVLRFFYPTALATAYGQRPKFIRAEHWAMAQHWTSCYRVSHDKMFFLKPLLESEMMASFGAVCMVPIIHHLCQYVQPIASDVSHHQFKENNS